MTQKDRRRSGPSKKTEWIEVRVSHEEKDSFLQACKRAGVSASDIVRQGMARFARQPQSRRHRLMFASGAFASLILFGSILAGAMQDQPAQPVLAGHPVDSVIVHILDQEGRTVEERVMGAIPVLDAEDIVPDAELVSELYIETEEGEARVLTYQAYPASHPSR